jgi:ATP synthase protein I
MNESGQGLGYLVLFTEIGFTLLVTTLIGVAAGYWLDGRMGTLPVMTIVGFFAGAGLGSWAIYKLVSRFLATIE